jgi:hypothetical protein
MKHWLFSRGVKWAFILVILVVAGTMLTQYAIRYGEEEVDRQLGRDSGSDEKLFRSVRKILRESEQLELYSLDPDPLKRSEETSSTFHHFQILGSTVVTDVKKRQKIVSDVEYGIKKHDGQSAMCFNPRHGIRATSNGTTTDLVICFECRWVRVSCCDQPNEARLGTSLHAEAVLDQILIDANIPLAPKPK